MYLKIKKDVANGEIAPAYVFYGEERFLLQSALNCLIEAVAPGGNTSFNLDRLDGAKSNLREITGLANTLPFLAERKLIVVDNAEWFATSKKIPLPEKCKTVDEIEDPEIKAIYLQDLAEEEARQIGIDEMIAYLTDPSPTTCLVFLAGETINKTKKLTKAAAKSGVLAEFPKLKGYEAVRWLDEILQDRRLQMDNDTKKQFMFNCGESCAFAMQELDKLECYKDGDSKITLADLDLLMAKNTNANIFHLVDNVAEGHLETSLALLQELLLTENEYTVLPLLTSHFQTVLMAKNLHSRGYNQKMIMDMTGKRSAFVIEKAVRQGGKYSEKQLKLVLEILLQADKKVKTGITTSVKEALETAIIQICYLTKK